MKDKVFDEIKDILAKIIAQLISFFLGVFYTSYITTGEFFNLFKSFTIKNYISFFAIIFFVSLLLFLILRFFKINKKNSVSNSGIGFPLNENNYFPHALVNHAGVNWRVLYPKPHSTHFSYNSRVTLNSDNYIVSESPYCPKCETELIQENAVFSRYIWKCPTCDFSKRSLKDRKKLRNEASKVARNKMQIFNNKKLFKDGSIED